MSENNDDLQKLLGTVGADGNRSASVTCDVLGKIVSMNTDFTEMVGLSAEELEYQSIFWFLPKREGQEIREALMSVVADSSLTREISMTIGDSVKNKEINIIPIVQNSKIIGHYWLFISEKSKKNLTIKLNWSNDHPIPNGGLLKVGTWSYGFDKKEFFASKDTYRIFGRTPEEFDGSLEKLLKFIVPVDRDRVASVIGGVIDENPFEMEFSILKSNQEVRHLKHLIEVVYDENMKRVSIRGNVQDITEQKELVLESKRTLEEMKLIQNKCKFIIESSQDVVEIINSDGLVQYISPAIEQLMGFKSYEIEGHYIWDFVVGKEKNALKELFKTILEEPQRIIVGTVQSHKKSGEIIYLEVTMSNFINNPEVNGVVLNWKDVTTKVNLDNRIHQLANYDDLSGLPNRTYFKEKVIEEVQNHENTNSRFALFMVDIEGFKGFNNVLSYEFGDELIIKIGKSIQSIFRDENIFISRYYGDQFGLIVENVKDIAECQEIGNRLLELFLQPLIIEQYEMYVAASIGFSVFPEDGINYEQLLKTASIALRRAKDAGEQRYQAYSPQIDVKTFKEFSLRNDLRKAIDKKELLIYYQPIMHLKTGKILGLEALMRWEHPEWGIVPPDEFIPIAESTGLIISMGKWLLDQVCQDYLRWAKKGYPVVKIAVNYSGIQFFQVNFVDDILSTIEKYGLNPDFLILEITESVLIEQGKKTEKDLAELKRKGVQIAIDDFGTGYSSLAYLNAIKVDILKIDREFLKNVPENENSEKILKAIINLARDLNIKIVAEGISNWKQLNFLREINGVVGQGYIYSKPLPIEAIELKLAVGVIEPQKNYDEASRFNMERRQSYRVEFKSYLEADMTIIEIGGNKAKVGNTKALIKNIGPGGLCFITNVKLPVKKDLILGFVTELMGKQVKVHGTPVWSEELEQGLHIIGLEFTFDENTRMELTRLLNSVQIRVKKDYGFNDGKFITESIKSFFNANITGVVRQEEKLL